MLDPPSAFRALCALMPVMAIGAAAGAARAEDVGCLDAVAFIGEEVDVSEARQVLTQGLLASVPAAACTNTELEVGHEGDVWRIELRQGDQAVTRSSADVAILGSWVESWLAPMESLPAAAQATATATAPSTTGASHPAPTESEPESAPSPALGEERARPQGVAIEVGLSAGLDLDRLGPAWPGAELRLTAVPTRAFWLGMAAAGAWAPRREQTSRRALRMSIRSGYRHRSDWGELRLGAGVGILSGDARRRLDQDTVVFDEAAGPFLEAHTALAFALNDQLSVNVGGALRWLIPDELRGASDPLDDPLEEFEPEAIPALSFTLTVGVGWYQAKRP